MLTTGWMHPCVCVCVRACYRFLLIFQRLQRSALFAPSTAAFTVKQDSYVLTPINNLIAVRGRRFVFGMLSQLEVR